MVLLVLSWIFTPLFFSTCYIANGFLTKYSMPLEYMMFYRLMLSSFLILLIILIKRQRVLIKKSELKVSLLVSVSQLNVWLACYGTKYLITGLVPCVCLLQIFVAELLSAIVEKRKMRKNIIISGMLGFVGIVMLCNQQLTGVGDVDMKKTIIGIFYSFISVFAAAAGNIIYERGGQPIREMPRTTFLLYNCFFAGIFLLILGLIIQPLNGLYNPAIFDIKYLGVMTYLALTATIIALFGLYYIIEKQGAVKATYMNFILPILSMTISTLFEGFRWNVVAFVGMLILLYSVWLGIKTPTDNSK